MLFKETKLKGSYVIEIEIIQDERGYFARTVCVDEFAQHNLNGKFVQQSISLNHQIGILRGLHYQEEPYQEDKLIRVTNGSLFDVIVDMRPNSETICQWFGVELSASNLRQLYIPKGFAHGFQTLEKNTVILYEMTTKFMPEAQRGIYWNDPHIGIAWPDTPTRLVSNRDKMLPLYDNLSQTV